MIIFYIFIFDLIRVSLVCVGEAQARGLNPGRGDANAATKLGGACRDHRSCSAAAGTASG